MWRGFSILSISKYNTEHISEKPELSIENDIKKNKWTYIGVLWQQNIPKNMDPSYLHIY